MTQMEAQHADPVWRDRSDFVIAASVEDADVAVEQLFARKVSARCFEICCIPPFFSTAWRSATPLRRTMTFW